MDRRAAEQFLEDYRTVFESLDAAAITAKFTFPCHVVGQAETVTVISVPGPESWNPAIERIVGAYRMLRVASASVSSVQIVPVTSGSAQVVVTWRLADADSRPLYSFTACYTVVDTAGGPRIAAIVHDEGPKLQQALSRRA